MYFNVFPATVTECAVTTGGVSSKNFASPFPSAFAVSFVFVSAPCIGVTNIIKGKIPSAKCSLWVVIKIQLLSVRLRYPSHARRVNQSQSHEKQIQSS